MADDIYPEFWNDEWVKKHQLRAATEGVIDCKDWVCSILGDLPFTLPSVESPLEAVFQVWWEALCMIGFREDICLIPQHQVKAGGRNYRLDFSVTTPNYTLLEEARLCGITAPHIAIELDGHDFHERTKEQVAERNERDRDLQADGWVVLHFSGSEVNAEPRECVMKAAWLARRRFNEFASQVRIAVRDRLAAQGNAKASPTTPIASARRSTPSASSGDCGAGRTADAQRAVSR